MARKLPENKGYSGAVLALATVAALAVGIFVGLQLTVLLPSAQDQHAAHGPMPSKPPAAAPQQSTAAEQAATHIPGLKARAEANPSSAPAWTDLGNAYFDADMPAQAVDAYRRALDLAPGSADVWTDMGVMLREQGKFPEAMAAFDKARELDPGHRNSRFNKGVVLFHDLGDRPGALAAWKELLALDPEAMAPTGAPLKNMIRELEKE